MIIAWGGFARFDLLEVGLLDMLGSTCLRCVFLGLRFLKIFFNIYIYIYIFWVGCVVFLDWFRTLGLCDLIILLGFEKMVALRFMILFSSWIFWVFACLFPKKFLGLQVCLLGTNMKFMFLGKRMFLRIKKKVKKKKIYYINVYFLFLIF